jgi:O-antigen/teichoic acid export membrane protein
VGVVLVAHVGLFLIGQYGSLVQVASIRATTSLLSPVSLVFTGLTVSLTPTLRGADGKTRSGTLKVFWGLVLAASVVATVVVAIFGTRIISVVFGASTVPPYSTLIVGVLSVVVFSLGSPLLAQVRVSSSYFGIAAIRILTGIVTIFVLIFFMGGDSGLVFFCCQLGQAALILVGAFFIVKKVRDARLRRTELTDEISRQRSGN